MFMYILISAYLADEYEYKLYIGIVSDAITGVSRFFSIHNTEVGTIKEYDVQLYSGEYIQVLRRTMYLMYVSYDIYMMLYIHDRLYERDRHLGLSLTPPPTATVQCCQSFIVSDHFRSTGS